MWFLWLIVCHSLPHFLANRKASFTNSLHLAMSALDVAAVCYWWSVSLSRSPYKKTCWDIRSIFFIEQVVKFLESKPAWDVSYVLVRNYMKPLNSGLYISYSPDRHLSHSIVRCLFKCSSLLMSLAWPIRGEHQFSRTSTQNLSKHQQIFFG